MEDAPHETVFLQAPDILHILDVAVSDFSAFYLGASERAECEVDTGRDRCEAWPSGVLGRVICVFILPVISLCAWDKHLTEVQSGYRRANGYRSAHKSWSSAAIKGSVAFVAFHSRLMLERLRSPIEIDDGPYYANLPIVWKDKKKSLLCQKTDYLFNQDKVAKLEQPCRRRRKKQN